MVHVSVTCFQTFSTFQLKCLSVVLFAGLVARLRYPVGKQDKSAPSTAGFSYGESQHSPVFIHEHASLSAP